MEIKITRFENGEILIRDTEKMKTVENKIVEVVVREYPTTKENLIGILGQVEKLEQEAIARKVTETEQPKDEENKGE